MDTSKMEEPGVHLGRKLNRIRRWASRKRYIAKKILNRPLREQEEGNDVGER